MKRIQGTWRNTSDRRIYRIEGNESADDVFIGTAASGDDAAKICDEVNKIINEQNKEKQ